MQAMPTFAIKPGWQRGSLFFRWPPAIGAVLMVLGLVAWRGWACLGGLPIADAALDNQARRFVTLGLTLGKLFPSEVDSYYGPDSLRPPSIGPVPSLAMAKAQVVQLEQDLLAFANDPRAARLKERTDRLAALIDQLAANAHVRFDDEAKALYGLEPAVLDPQSFKRARDELNRLLPGDAPLASRVEAFRARYIVPKSLRPALFARALAECRARTLRHWSLPAGERLDVEWTSSVDAAWHRYLGQFHSTLQINPQAVAFAGSILDVACHEGYPGHHAQFAQAEAASRGMPVEDTIVLLRSPGSVLREGAADYSVGLAFPPAERLAFERDVLFPMAGFRAEDAASFEQIRRLIDQLAPAALPILRGYRDHALTADLAASALEHDALIASPLALLGFVDDLGAYVVGYTGVREQVRSIVNRAAMPEQARWARLRCLVLLADQMPLANIGAAIDHEGAVPRSCPSDTHGGRP